MQRSTVDWPSDEDRTVEKRLSIEMHTLGGCTMHKRCIILMPTERGLLVVVWVGGDIRSRSTRHQTLRATDAVRFLDPNSTTIQTTSMVWYGMVWYILLFIYGVRSGQICFPWDFSEQNFSISTFQGRKSRIFPVFGVHSPNFF